MKCFGNQEKLKKSIEKRYDQEIKEVRKEAQAEIKEIKKETQQECQLVKAKIEDQARKKARQEASKVYSEERLKAKKDFEEAREKEIEKIFSQLKERLPDIAHSKRYLSFVKKKMKEENLQEKEVSIIADGDYYQKLFPPSSSSEYEEDPDITGVKIVRGELTYDLTLDTAFQTKKPELRLAVSKILGE